MLWWSSRLEGRTGLKRFRSHVDAFRSISPPDACTRVTQETNPFVSLLNVYLSAEYARWAEEEDGLAPMGQRITELLDQYSLYINPVEVW